MIRAGGERGKDKRSNQIFSKVTALCPIKEVKAVKIADRRRSERVMRVQNLGVQVAG